MDTSGKVRVEFGGFRGLADVVVYSLIHATSAADLVIVASSRDSLSKSCGRPACINPLHLMKSAKFHAKAEVSITADKSMTLGEVMKLVESELPNETFELRVHSVSLERFKENFLLKLHDIFITKLHFLKILKNFLDFSLNFPGIFMTSLKFFF